MQNRVPTLAEQLAAWLAAADPASLRLPARDTAHRLLLDVTALCLAARRSDYIAATLAAAGGVPAALGLPAPAVASALGIAGSMASGIIEYLAEGTSTKRMHAGWAAQSGIRAALMARGGFDGPRTVLEGRHGFYSAFAPSRTPDFSPLLHTLGSTWIMETIAFKPYA